MTSRTTAIAVSVIAGLALAVTDSRDAAADAGNADERLSALMEEFWDAEVADRPFFPNVMGDLTHLDAVDQLGEAALEARLERYDAALAALATIDRSALSAYNLPNRDTFEWMLTNERALLALPNRYAAIAAAGRWYDMFTYAARGVPLLTREDFEHYAARLSKIGAHADEAIALLRDATRLGYVAPCAVVERRLPMLKRALAVDVDEHFAVRRLAEIPADAEPEFASDIRTRIRSIVSETVIPAQQRYLDFYRDEYAPACRQTAGLASLEHGGEIYRALLDYYATTPDDDPRTVHEVGLAEVARIRGEMQSIVDEVGFDGDLPGFFRFMRTNPDFYVSDADAYLARAAAIAKKIDGVLPRYFAYLPRNRFTIVPVPADRAPTSALASYQPGSLSGGIPGRYFINLHDLETRSLNDLPAVGLHEASPGHHLQLSIQQELDALPRFRRAYYISAFGEGWGLYSEFLGEEMGIYETPYERFSRLTLEIWRACRLVVDSGIHAFGWTRQQAIDYMTENTALSANNIVNEVDRYIMNPGQALSYKLGEFRIRELRDRAEEALGSEFSLRDFHAHLLLGGSMPMKVLDTHMTEWLEARRSSSAH